MPLDEREFLLNEAARKIMVASNYDPHFSGLEDRLIMETKLFLTRHDALRKYMAVLQMQDTSQVVASPIPMILYCPKCFEQHIDAEEPHKPDCALTTDRDVSNFLCTCGRWANPPHRSHLCHFCGHVWRPADVPTNGVAEITTRGSKDSDRTPARPRWRHLEHGSRYVELGRGEFLCSYPDLTVTLYEGNRLVAYQGPYGTIWFRLEHEFDDGRFEKIEP